MSTRHGPAGAATPCAAGPSSPAALTEAPRRAGPRPGRAQVGSVLVSIDPEKLLFIFVIAVLVLGPERLPQAARTLGRGLAELRKYTSSFQSEVKNVLAEPRAIIDAAVRDADPRPSRQQNGPVPEPQQEEGGGVTSGRAGPAGDDGAAEGENTAVDAGSRAGRDEGYDAKRRPAGAPGSANNGTGPARARREPADLSAAMPGAPDDPGLN